MKEVRQCSSCGGFCKKSGCERANVEPTPTLAMYGALVSQVDRMRKLLQDALYALEYASDMTMPEGMSGCNCPICMSIRAIEKELGKK